MRSQLSWSAGVYTAGYYPWNTNPEIHTLVAWGNMMAEIEKADLKPKLSKFQPSGQLTELIKWTEIG